MAKGACGTTTMNGTIRPADPFNAEWVTALLLGALAVLAITNLSSPRKWRLLSQAMFRMRLGRQALREEIDLRDRTFLGLMLVSVALLSLFGWQGLSLAGPASPVPYLQLFGTILAVLLSHSLLLRAIAWVFNTDHGLGEHLSTGLLLFILTGMAILPIVVLFAYRPAWRQELLVAGLGVIVLLLVYRWVRAVWIGLGEGTPFRYIILYLCTAEVVPVLLLIRAFR